MADQDAAVTSTYENVKFQKLEGKLVLSATGISFGRGKKKLQLPWENVAMHQVNPKSKGKALLKVVLKEDKPTWLFQAVDRNQLEQINEDILARLQKLPSKAPRQQQRQQPQPQSNGASSFDPVEKPGVYESVIFRNTKGALQLFCNQFKFQGESTNNNGTSGKVFQLDWKEISKQQTSPPKVAKCMLKLMKQDGKAITFEVSNRSELEALNKSVQKLRKLRSLEMIPVPTAADLSTFSTTNPVDTSQSERACAADGCITYSNIQLNATTGSLTLTNEHIAFQPPPRTKAKTKSISWDQVSKVQVNPPSHVKVLLKILLFGAGTILLTLPDRKTQEQLKDDITTQLQQESDTTRNGQATPNKDNSGLSTCTISDGAQSILEGVYQGVKYGSNEGILTLSRDSIVFQSNTASDSVTNYAWKDITKHQCSPKKIPKALLKLVMATGTAKTITFQLSDRKDLDQIRNEIAVRLKEAKEKPEQVVVALESSPINIEAVPVSSRSASTSAEVGESSQSPEDDRDDSLQESPEDTNPAAQDENSPLDSKTASCTMPEIIEPKEIEPADEEDLAPTDSIKYDQAALPTNSNKPNDNSEDSPEETSDGLLSATASLLEDTPFLQPSGDASSSDSNQKTEESPQVEEMAIAADSSEKSTEDADNPGDITLCSPTPESAMQSTNASINDILADDDEFQPEPRQSQVISDRLAGVFVGVASSDSDEASNSDHSDDNNMGGIHNLLAISDDMLSENKNSGSVDAIHDIFDESFASLMSDAGFSMMDDDSDDDFSVVTLDTVNFQAGNKKATSLPKDYSGVIFQSTNGTVTSTQNNFLFQPDKAGHPKTEATQIEWKNVERHYGSPPKHKKVMLKIILHDGSSKIFTLPGRKELELIRMDMTSRLHEFRKTNVSSSVLEGLVISGSNKQGLPKNGYIPNYKRLPPGAKSSSAYHPVHFEQSEGSLFLSWDQLSFQPSGLGDVDKARTVFWDSVAGHEMSQVKPILTVNLLDGAAFTFKFPNRKELEKCEKDTDARLVSYDDEFESVPQKQLDGSSGSYTGSQDAPSLTTDASAKKAPMQKSVVSNPDKNTLSLLDMSHSSIDEDFEDADDFFAVNGLPPPPPPTMSRSSSDSSATSSSSSSSSSEASATSGDASDSECSDQEDSRPNEAE